MRGLSTRENFSDTEAGVMVPGDIRRDGWINGLKDSTATVDVINVETNITNVAIRIMRDGVKVFTKGGCTLEDIDLSIIPVIVVLNNISTTVLILDILLPVL